MQTALIISKKDPASLNIYESLKSLKLPEDTFIHLIDEWPIYSDNLDKKVKASTLLFLSKHSSASKIPTISIHPTGNFSEAKFGGISYHLNPVPASLMKSLFLNLNSFNTTEFELTLETTHHGPKLDTPSLFIEIGSYDEQWQNKDAAKVIVTALIQTLSNNIEEYETVIAIGGMHYASTFSKILLNTNLAISHIIPKHLLLELDEKMLLQAIHKTKEKISFILLDWKGLGKEKPRILELLESLNLEYKRTDKL